MVLREEPGKQRPRSCRTQELARSSAQENERQKKARPTGLNRNRRAGEGTGATGEKISCRAPSAPGSTRGLDSSAPAVSGGWLSQMRSVSAVRSA